MKENEFTKGLRAGIPIGLGYLSVSFSFGIMAVASGLYWYQALIISMLTLTSAGQLAGINIMSAPNRYLEMLISESTINIRYSFMSISLSQRVEPKFKGIFRWLLGFFITDEIFALCSMRKELTRSYMAGVSVLPWIGWSLGTLIGALVGNILPEIVLNSLTLALYAMFVAIIVPKAKEDKTCLLAIIISCIFSLIFAYVPFISKVPTGIAISISAIVGAIIVSLIFPIKDRNDDLEERCEIDGN